MGGFARSYTGGALPAEGDGRTNFGLVRAAFFRSNIDPRAWETMSMYELETMWRNMQPKTVPEPTDEEWDEGMDLLADATAGLPDVEL